MYHYSRYIKRAKRTCFTNYQIKVLQEHFERNAYPRNYELHHLSHILNLSPRVVLVWFQNARQKSRKMHNKQPTEPKMNESPFQRTTGLNNNCKKCSAVLMKRKLEVERDVDSDDQPRDKRLRKTKLPEQLDYLHQKCKIGRYPCSEQPENMSAKVGLIERVVQARFQNTRARECKFMHNAHHQLIHKRCPFCHTFGHQTSGWDG
ncbi:hypothetical protein FSP39_007801 [Pinctada imbricata]|uniref:Homeobox domain-containing protein n=1 Tax=Pinctada imbricata TaxID=66713 RepID=A0AA88YVN6_PINIB|nr:hypothetical protein FSP39_007801 [Pinctada imbricata]